MELILWRHAEAEDGNGKPDGERELTRKGRRQAEHMAAWLKPRLAGDWRILVSPARRTLETVDPLGLSFDVTADVGTGADPRRLLRATGWPGTGQVLVVGHNPTLSEVAAHLLGGGGSLTFRKGGAWWFATRTRDGEEGTILRAVMNPDLLDP
jgi:phosphohistidine phosphatase